MLLERVRNNTEQGENTYSEVGFPHVIARSDHLQSLVPSESGLVTELSDGIEARFELGERRERCSGKGYDRYVRTLV